MRRRIVLGFAIASAFLLVAVAIAIPIVERQRAAEVAAARDTTLEDVRVFDDLSRDHADGEVDYDEQPPAGGPHDPVWLACGEYDEPVRDENAVHSLEHGTVWITYRPDLSESDLARLSEKLPAEGILSPYPGQDAPVVVTVWGRQLELTGAGDAGLDLFLAEYGDGATSPEPLASCQGGVRDADGDTGTAV